MFRLILRAAVRRSLRDVRHVRPVTSRAARGTIATLYRRLEREFGVLAPPVALLAPAPECAAATWTLLRESLLVPGRTQRSTREAMATAVSRDNSCPYCVEVHGATLDSLDSTGEGPSTSGDLTERAELGAVALTFQHINRLVNVFLPESPLPGFAPMAVHGTLRRATGTVIAAGDGRARSGPPLDLLPEAARGAPLPEDLGWAAEAPRIRSALAAATLTIDAAGEGVLPLTVRNMLHRHLEEHGVGPAGISRAWVEEVVRDLPRDDRPLGRLVLLTARASYQVDEGTIAGCRELGVDDPALVRIVSWAAMTAARHAPIPTAGEGPEHAHSHTPQENKRKPT